MSSKSTAPPDSKGKPSKTTPTSSEDWYERRHELEPGMVFLDYQGDMIRLYMPVPGDGTDWFVDTYYGPHWCCDMVQIHPGDLRKRLTEYE